MPYFFDASQGAHEQITGLYDFVWPTAVAMWNLRWQALGYLQVRPDTNVKTLDGRFAEGAGIHGANLKRACLDHTWEQQQEAFAQILLVNVFAVYEGWVAEVLTDLKAKTKANEKGLQFPSTPARSETPAVPATATTPAVPSKPARPATTGAISVITALTANESPTLKSSFYSTLKAAKRYNLTKLENQLRCYRFFKELRNSMMHAGGTASEQAVEAYDNFKLIATPGDLGVREVPQHEAITKGAKPALVLRGVVGFSGMVLQMITTLDAELTRSEYAEQAFVGRWKKAHANTLTLPSSESRRLGRFKGYVRKAGFPKPQDVLALADFAKARMLIRF